MKLTAGAAKMAMIRQQIPMWPQREAHASGLNFESGEPTPKPIRGGRDTAAEEGNSHAPS
jgi:hypothetical protein